jgi:transposase-like protein
MICSTCGKHFTKNKYSDRSHSLCRSCLMKRTYATKPGLKENALKRRKETCVDKYGTDNVAKVEAIAQKWVDTKIERFGYSGYFQDPSSQKKVQENAHSDEAYEKRRATCSERYGTDHHMQNADVLKDFKASMLEKTGFENPMHNPSTIEHIIDIYGRIGSGALYRFDDRWFDSSWELAYYIWLKDNCIDFEFHPKMPIIYTEDEKSHRYYPDFIVEGRIHEIKGDHFFNDKGEPYCAIDGEYWWGKYNMLVERKAVILRKKEIAPILIYVAAKYGKEYLNSFKRTRKRAESSQLSPAIKRL